MENRRSRKLFTRFPALKDEWDFKKNEADPYKLTYGSSKKVYWKCKNNHYYQSTINNRTRGRGCPFCAGVKIEKGRSLEDLYDSIVAEWGINNSFRPSEISPKSSKVVEWECKVCKGVWQARVYNRTVKGSGCPYCARRKRPSFKYMK